jgi:hypothetical protein
LKCSIHLSAAKANTTLASKSAPFDRLRADFEAVPFQSYRTLWSKSLMRLPVRRRQPDTAKWAIIFEWLIFARGCSPVAQSNPRTGPILTNSKEDTDATKRTPSRDGDRSSRGSVAEPGCARKDICNNRSA